MNKPRDQASEDRTARLIRWWDWLFVVVLAVASAAAWMTPALRATGGTFSASIDDAFIHAQYARYFAAGRLFVWSPDAGYSLGATSPLYPVLLAVGYLAGFREHWIMAFALILNTAGLALALGSVLKLVGRVAPRAIAWGAALVVAASGAVWWGVGSGMEIGVSLGLFGLFLVWIEHDWFNPPAHGPRWSTVALAALVGLIRPDMLVLTAPLLIGAVLGRTRRWGWRGWGRGALAVLPLLLVFALNGLRTGMFSPNSIVLKSLWRSPVMAADERWSLFWQHLAETPEYIKQTCGLGWFSLAVVCMGLVIALTVHRIWRGFRGWRPELLFDLSLCIAAMFFFLIPASLAGPSEGEYRLYHGAFLALLVAGIRWVGACVSLAENPTERWTFGGVALAGLAALTAGGLLHLPAYHDQFMRDYTFINDSQIAMGRLLRDQRLSDPRLRGRVLLHEAGAIPYFAGGEFYDLVGLCSNPGLRLTEYYLTDNQLCFEALEHEPSDRWPDLSIVYADDLQQFNKLPLASEAIVPRVPYPRPHGVVDNDPTHRLGLFRFPRELLGSGHKPTPRDIPPGWGVRDRLDVADLIDERAHSFRIDWPAARVIRYTHFQVFPREGPPVVADYGRGLTLPAHWRMKNLIPGQPVQLWARVEAARHCRYRIRIGDKFNSEFTLEPGEMTVITLGEAPSTSSADLVMTIEPIEGWCFFYQMWALQPGAIPAAMAHAR